MVATPAGQSALAATGQAAVTFLRRHVTGDWGPRPPKDLVGTAAAGSNGVDTENDLLSLEEAVALVLGR